MNLYQSNLYISDLDYIIENLDILNDMRGSSVLIIGARGLICSAIADILFRYNEKTDAGIHLYLAGRDGDKLKNRFSRYADSGYLSVIEYDSEKQGDLISKLPDEISYIIDGIGPSSPGDINSYPLTSLYTNVALLKDLLQYADSAHIKGLLYVSSSEVYGTRPEGGPFKEDDYGWIDILSPRSSYACGKRSCETLCACFSKEKNVRALIARPGHVYGPTARTDDDHIASAFALEAAKGHDLNMNSPGLQRRSYCYMLDCASAMLTILDKGMSGNAYNISNPESVLSIYGMMSQFADAAGVNLSISSDDKKDRAGDNPMPDSSLDSDKLLSLGWKGLFDAGEGAGHTIRILKEAMQS
jgi:nucleoside-diphosphate-sugar epimerase